VMETNSTINLMKKSVVKHATGSDVNNSNKETTPGGDGSSSSKLDQVRRKIVIMPVFFKPSSSSLNKSNSEPATPDSAHKLPTPSREGSEDEFDNEEDEEEGTASPTRKSVAKRHKKDWRRWQIQEDDDDEDEEEESEVDLVELGKMMRTKSSKSGKKKKMKRPQPNSNSPIEVSPLVQYLNWHSKDKRVCWDLRRTLRMAHDIIRRKAVQEEIDENQGKYKQSVSVFFEVLDIYPLYCCLSFSCILHVLHITHVYFFILLSILTLALLKKKLIQMLNMTT
jgi:hypothetical protein